MLKRRGQQHREGVTPPSLKRMSDTEYAAYFEAFGAIKNDYQALCLIGDKLREVETTARGLSPLDSQAHGEHAELSDPTNSRSPWEVCASLMRLNNNEVFLCKRVCERMDHWMSCALETIRAKCFATTYGASARLWN